ncbi:GIY-YIG nuclease family protein [Burkholderia sp. AU18528]|uniref:GIY-YIG nuclease family protein n=1 Tax=Burkholderia TaxID=32008 RepID=UPI00075B2970|nr:MULTISPECIES: GIY-YIG nuclease family protein [Burkholderia]KVH02727.1 excinuclease ABC subunit C [Burkholderia anthina]KVH11870.1 excinuclease ABC subunit C [Burkholderia anthina]KVM90692.1 excinuclease ABC subunit C [Burkholderia anthina]KVN62092.1 excinuclease ABC subunit C [Burkholderia anthina]KVX31900.1 excinuclease ABC subunit C [Burkholderia anthina]
MSWFLYLIECADDSVYTGITTDVAARFDEHASGKGARYTRSRKPRAVLASFPLPDRSSASRAEYWVKRLTPAKKRELAAGLRTLESVVPVVITLDESGDTKATARGRKKGQAENVDDAAKTAATEQVAGKKVKTGNVVGSATAASTAKPAKGKQASKSTKANQAAPDAKRAKTDGDAAAKKTSARGTPVKKTGQPPSASSNGKAPAAAGKLAANVREDAASAPARRRSSATKTAAAIAPSVAPPRAKRAKKAAATPPPASPSASRKTARAKQNRAAS